MNNRHEMYYSIVKVRKMKEEIEWYTNTSYVLQTMSSLWSILQCH